MMGPHGIIARIHQVFMHTIHRETSRDALLEVIVSTENQSVCLPFYCIEKKANNSAIGVELTSKRSKLTFENLLICFLAMDI